MRSKKFKMSTKTPLVLLIAKPVKELKAKGSYSCKTDTWSNRNYDLASAKKHNEDM